MILFTIYFCTQHCFLFSQTKPARFEPPEGKILVFIGQDNISIENYIGEVKTIPAGFMLYTSIHKMEGLDKISPDYGSGTMFADELINNYPDTALQLGLYMVGFLEDTYDGKFDENIDKLAEWLKGSNIPVFLRIGYEFDGPHNNYDPQEYQKAYRYIADKLKTAKVDTVAYVWHSYANRSKPELDSWYPGDEYVDWVGVTYFNQTRSRIDPVIAFAKDHNKPVMAAEATPKEIGSSTGKPSWNIWYKPFFNYVKTNNIKAICYINCNWDEMPMYKDQKWKDSRIESNAYIKDQWLKELKNAVYLNSSKGLFNNLGFQQKE